MTKSTIFHKLLAQNICFAVVVSIDSYTTINTDINQTDWFIIIKSSDSHKLDHITTHYSQSKYNLLEITLSEKQIDQFHAILNKFTQVESNYDGRAYEITGNPFKTHYKAKPPPVPPNLNNKSPLIASSSITGRCRVILAQHNLTTWVQVSKLSIAELQSWYRIGTITISQIIQQLKIRGLKLLINTKSIKA